MANYHFRIKSDKKKDGSRISAATHTEYIDREGKYKNIDEKQLMSLSYIDTLTGNNPIERLPESERLLYKSPFGIIKQDKNGIHVSPGASPETVAIALSVAKYVYGENISLDGNTNFKAKAIVAGKNLNYRINFTDKQSNEILKALQEDMENGERRREKIKVRNRKRKIPGEFYKHSFAELSRRNIAQRGFIVSTLPSLPVADKKKRKYSSTDRRMQSRRQNVYGNGNIFNGKSRADNRMRWLLSKGRGRRITETVNEIMTKMQRQNTFGESHAQYINREAAFKQRGGCMYKSHHLPPWADDSPKKFFAAADKYERANAERYKEIEFALPNELNLEQQKKIVDKFVNKHLSDFYYAYAIHDKIGSMSNGERHPHVHIMICTRKLDDVEKENPRSAKMFFHRANSDVPENGGCQKDEIWRGKNRTKFLKQLRESCADIQNEVLRKNGYSIGVDHRTLKEQREEALAKGDFFTAELLNRIPQKSVGPLAQLEKENKEIIKQRQMRMENHKKEIITFIEHTYKDIERKSNYEEQKIKNQKAFLKLQSDLNDIVFPEGGRQLWEDEIKNLIMQREQIETRAELTTWYADAIVDAQLELMTQTERENWQELKSLGNDLKLWREYRERYDAFSDDVNKEVMIQEIDNQINELNEKIILASDKVKPVFEQLKAEPYFSKAQKISAHLIYVNEFIKRSLEYMENKFGNDVARLMADLEKYYNAQDEYTNHEVYENLSEDVQQISLKLSKKRKELETQKKKIISKDRAMFIAKDVFTKQGFKKLRMKKRELQEQRKKGNKSPELAIEEQKLSEEETRLNKECSTPKAKAKLQKITAGILRRNLPEIERYNALKKEGDILRSKLSESRKRQKIVSETSKNIKYRIERDDQGGPATSLRDSRTIADGLGGNEKIAQLVAYSDEKNVAGMDNWKMLSEFEKEKRLAEEAMRG